MWSHYRTVGSSFLPRSVPVTVSQKPTYPPKPFLFFFFVGGVPSSMAVTLVESRQQRKGQEQEQEQGQEKQVWEEEELELELEKQVWEKQAREKQEHGQQGLEQKQ